jgi:hypothetical protein
MSEGRCIVCEDDFDAWDEAVAHARAARHKIERVQVDAKDLIPTTCFRCAPPSLVPIPLDNFFSHLEDVHGIARAFPRRS